MKTAAQWLSEYGESHQDKFNKIVHYICVPSIFFSLVGLLASIPLGGLPAMLPAVLAPYAHLGTALIIFGLVFYLRISFPLFVGMLLMSVLVLWGVNRLATIGIPLWASSLIIFVIAWIFQFIGHKHEGKKPSFFKDLQFLMIGPGWTLSHFYDMLGIKY